MLRLATRMLLRDLRSGELRVLLAALLIAVGSVATVGFFTDRVRAALGQEATRLLGGDLSLVADHPIPAAILGEAARLGLATTRTVTFPSMVLAGEATTLSEIKAVSDGYPLRGRVRILPSSGGADQEAGGIPAPGTVWAGDRLLSRLGKSATASRSARSG